MPGVYVRTLSVAAGYADLLDTAAGVRTAGRYNYFDTGFVCERTVLLNFEKNSKTKKTSRSKKYEQKRGAPECHKHKTLSLSDLPSCLH